MEAINVIDKELGNLTCSIWVAKRDEMSIFGEFVQID
jgi:hypothetical protein